MENRKKPIHSTHYKGASVLLEIVFYVLSETVFAHIFPVSTENENERVSLEFIFSVLSETVCPVFPVSAENKMSGPPDGAPVRLNFFFRF
jgi:hypothetical protein